GLVFFGSGVCSSWLVCFVMLVSFQPDTQGMIMAKHLPLIVLTVLALAGCGGSDEVFVGGVVWVGN
ncbi:hypothetical protein, partial [Neisseria sp. P0016.S006]|uniref:hypothetical protein n=1 Tax=Neisseria sp. P0016.S006 TaxID=3436772 RepID=UPI003F7E4B90